MSSPQQEEDDEAHQERHGQPARLGQCSCRPLSFAVLSHAPQARTGDSHPPEERSRRAGSTVNHVPVVAVIVLATLVLALAGFIWLIIMLGRGMVRDRDAMQIGPYNAWSPPPPSPPFPKPGHKDESG
jgi:hypothetical protein